MINTILHYYYYFRYIFRDITSEKRPVLTVDAAGAVVGHQRIASVTVTFVGVLHVDTDLTTDSGLAALIFI